VFESLKMNIDRRFRKKEFANKVFNGIKLQLLRSVEYVKAHIEIQEKERDEAVELWKYRQKRLNEEYEELNSHGYKNRREYFDSSWSGDNDTDMKLLDIVHNINQLSITKEIETDYVNTLNRYHDEIESSQKVLKLIEKILPIASHADINSLKEIDVLFLEHGCEQVLSIIDLPRAIFDQYYG
jgi:hypothetical protein